MSDIEQTPEVIEPLFKVPSILDKIPEIRFSKVTCSNADLGNLQSFVESK